MYFIADRKLYHTQEQPKIIQTSSILSKISNSRSTSPYACIQIKFKPRARAGAQLNLLQLRYRTSSCMRLQSNARGVSASQCGSASNCVVCESSESRLLHMIPLVIFWYLSYCTVLQLLIDCSTIAYACSTHSSSVASSLNRSLSAASVASIPAAQHAMRDCLLNTSRRRRQESACLRHSR